MILVIDGHVLCISLKGHRSGELGYEAGNATKQKLMAVWKSHICSSSVTSCHLWRGMRNKYMYFYVSNRLTFGMMEVHVQFVLWE